MTVQSKFYCSGIFNFRIVFQMTGGYPPYYDPYYDYYGEGYYNGYMGRPPGGKRYQGDRERHPSKGDKDKTDKDKAASKNLGGEEEFVSFSHHI